jgi:hypothetical protein
MFERPPPSLALRVRPRAVLDGITRLYHGSDQPRDLGPVGIEQGEVQRGRGHLPQSSSASRFTAGALAFFILHTAVHLRAVGDEQKDAHAQAGPGRPPPLTAPEEGGLEADPLVRMSHFSFCALKNSR